MVGDRPARLVHADALQLVSEEAAKLLVDEHGFTIEDAFDYTFCLGVLHHTPDPEATVRQIETLREIVDSVS